MKLHTKLAAAAAGLLLLTAGAAQAADGSVRPSNYTFANGDHGFALIGSGGPINPGVLVGFNPQPDPPGDVLIPTISLRNPFAPMITHLAASEGWQFQLAFTGLGDGGAHLLPDAPNADGVDPASWVGFNPQPDPPGNFLAGQFNFATPGDPFMGFSLTIDGTPISFAFVDGGGVPEPAEWVLLIAGFGLVGVILRRRREPLAA